MESLPEPLKRSSSLAFYKSLARPVPG